MATSMTLNDLQAKGKDRLMKMTKAELTDAILSLSTSTTPDPNTAICMRAIAEQLGTHTLMIENLTQVQKESTVHLKALTQELATEKAKNSKLCSEMVTMKESLSSMHIYIERVDAADRANQTIITGVSETCDLDDATDDISKLNLIFDTIDCNDEISGYTYKRLGKPRTDNKPRPILVTVSSGKNRDAIYKNRSKLKNRVGGQFEFVTIKKDCHPCMRREWKRLFDKLDAENSKDENKDHGVIFDRKKRILVQDGEIIDIWMPNWN